MRALPPALRKKARNNPESLKTTQKYDFLGTRRKLSAECNLQRKYTEFHINRSSAYCLKGWGDGTSRNDVSPYECSGTPGPQINRPLSTMSLDWYIPVILITYMYCIIHIHVMSGTYQSRDIVFPGRLHNLGDQGSQKNLFRDTSFRDIQSPHQKKVPGKSNVHSLHCECPS